MPNISEKVCWFVNESAHFSSFSRSFYGFTCSIYMVQCCSISGIQSLLQVVTWQRKYDLRRTGVSDERTGKQRDPAFRGSEDSRGVGRRTGGMVLLRTGRCSGPVGKHRSQAIHQEDARPRSAVVGQLGYNLYYSENED